MRPARAPRIPPGWAGSWTVPPTRRRSVPRSNAGDPTEGGTVAEVADAIAYLASPTASSTTGMWLFVDGGMANLRLRPQG